ncbi:PREDICTED: intraflagellar transport protein 20 homolog [Aptenodytes forsteri]|nr:PREDICTED: intraflagellar transport protein 20 homolog [Aptenodytes forsteri]
MELAREVIPDWQASSSNQKLCSVVTVIYKKFATQTKQLRVIEKSTGNCPSLASTTVPPNPSQVFTAIHYELVNQEQKQLHHVSQLRPLGCFEYYLTIFFFAEIVEFQKIVGSLIELVDQLAKAAETEKMKAIGARNLLKSIAKQREAQEQQLQALIAEKKMQLERYRIEYETLCKIEADQNEFIDQFIFQK